MGAAGGDVEAGFVKLQGEDFEYYMQTYSIILGRNSKKSNVDVDLSSLGGGMNISRNHARIFYDFTRRHFALEVLRKNGCLVEGVLHLPGNPPVKLDSQDMLQIGDKEFYFLLPVRSILGGRLGPRHHVAVVPQHGYHSGGRAERMVGPLLWPERKGERGSFMRMSMMMMKNMLVLVLGRRWGERLWRDMDMLREVVVVLLVKPDCPEL